MTKVLMEKDTNVITVDSSAVNEHRRLGWEVAIISNDLANAGITVGAQDGTTINVAIQLNDSAGAALAESMSLGAFLCDDANGLDVTAAAPDGGVAIGTEGGCIPLTANKVFLLNTNAAGLVDVDITESLAATWYLALVFPNGERVVSDAITFA